MRGAYTAIAILLLTLLACERNDSPEPQDRSSAAYIGKVPIELRRAVRIYYAENDWPEPTTITVDPPPEPYFTFIIKVEAEGEPTRELIGDMKGVHWTVYEPQPGIKDLLRPDRAK